MRTSVSSLVGKMLAALARSPAFLTGNVIAFFILSNLLISALSLRLDLTEDQVNSLSESTETVLTKLQDPVLVEAYITAEVPGEITTILDGVRSLLLAMDRQGGQKLEVVFIDPDTEEKIARAREHGIRGIPLEKRSVDSYSQKLAYFGLHLKMGDTTALIPLVQNNSIVRDLEYRLLREIKKLSRTTDASGVAVATVPGSLEFRPWRSYSDQDKDNLYAFRKFAEEDLGHIDDVDLQNPIAPDIHTVMLTGLPDLTDQNRTVLNNFVRRGGNLLLMLGAFEFRTGQADPRLASLGLGGDSGGYARVPRERLDRLNEWLSQFGLRLRGEILFEPGLGVNAIDVQGQYAVPVQNPAWALYSRDTDTLVYEGIPFEYTQQVVFPWYSGIDLLATPRDITTHTIVRTTTSAVTRERSMLDLREMQEVGQSPGDVNLSEPVPVFVLAEGSFFEKGVRSRIALLGSPYLVSDIFLRNQSNQQIFVINQSMIMGLLEYLSGEPDLIAARSRVQTIHQLDPVDEAYRVFFTWFHVLFIPVALAFYGTYRLIRRNSGLRGSVHHD